MSDKKLIYNGDLWRYNQFSLGSENYLQSGDSFNDFYKINEFNDDFHAVKRVNDGNLVRILVQEAEKLNSQEKIPVEAYF